jgi:hypothetical protein
MDRAIYGFLTLEVGVRGLPRVNFGLVVAGLLLGYIAPTLTLSLSRINPWHALVERIKKAMNGTKARPDITACMENLQTTVDKLRYIPQNVTACLSIKGSLSSGVPT